jgi:flotillin
VTMQVEAVKNLKIDKITVWDSGGAGKNGNTTANFLSGFIKSLPPLHDIAEMAGLDLPKYLGRMGVEEQTDGHQPEAGQPAAKG